MLLSLLYWSHSDRNESLVCSSTYQLSLHQAENQLRWYQDTSSTENLAHICNGNTEKNKHIIHSLVGTQYQLASLGNVAFQKLTQNLALAFYNTENFCGDICLLHTPPNTPPKQLSPNWELLSPQKAVPDHSAFWVALPSWRISLKLILVQGWRTVKYHSWGEVKIPDLAYWSGFGESCSTGVVYYVLH